MESLFAVVGLSVTVFVSTNIDDVFVLVTFLADKNFRVSRSRVFVRSAGPRTDYRPAIERLGFRIPQLKEDLFVV